MIYGTESHSKFRLHFVSLESDRAAVERAVRGRAGPGGAARGTEGERPSPGTRIFPGGRHGRGTRSQLKVVGFPQG